MKTDDATSCPASWASRKDLGELAKDLTAYLDGLAKRGEKLPAHRYRGRLMPMALLIAHRASIPYMSLYRCGLSSLLKACERRLGLTTDCLEVAFVPEGWRIPWRTAMGVGDMKLEAGNLVSAAYIVCAYLSGMRDSEVQDLRRGCLEKVADQYGVIRYRVHSLERKRRLEPKARAWVVIEPVARAIEVLERLTAPFAGIDDHLFMVLHKGVEHRTLKQNVCSRLRAFALHCNAVLAPRLDHGAGDGGRRSNTAASRRLGPIPDGPDGPWHLTTRQLRKMVAGFIANRPFGLVSGFMQYGHASLQMFEGCAGSKESGFRDEVAAESWLRKASCSACTATPGTV